MLRTLARTNDANAAPLMAISPIDAGVWLALTGLGLLMWTGLPMAMSAMLCAAGFALSALSPNGATAAILSAVPFVYHAIPIGSQDFSPLEIAILLASAALATRVGIAVWRREGRAVLSEQLTPLPPTLVVCALGLVGVCSLAFVADAEHISESVRELRTTILEPIAVFFVVRWSVRHRGLELIWVALIASGIVVAADGIAQFLSRTGGVIGDDVFRARGPYPHPNNLALYLERIVMLVAGVALVGRQMRWIAVPILIVVAAGLALTFSRGALVGVGAGAAALIAMWRPARGWLYLVVGVAISLLAFAETAGGRLWSTGTEGEQSTRELLWKSSVGMAMDNPMTGVGLDQFLYQYSRRYVDPSGWPERYTSHPHNLLLDVWLRLGIAGLVVFLAIVVIVIHLVRRRHAGADFSGAVATGAIAGLLAGLAHGMVDNGFFLPDLAVLTWCFVALLEHHSAAFHGSPTKAVRWLRSRAAPA